MHQTQPQLLNRKAAAEYLGVSVSSLSLMKARGEIQTVKLRPTAHPKYKLSDLKQLIDSLERGNGYCAATQGK